MKYLTWHTLQAKFPVSMAGPRGFMLGAFLALTLGPSVAGAQGVAEEPPKVQEIQAVERGVFVEADVGFNFILNEVGNRSYGPWPPAFFSGVFAGYDVLPVLSISVGALAMAASVSLDESTPRPRGDLFFIIPMVQAQFALLTTERNFVFLRGGLGYSVAVPERLQDLDYGGKGPVFAGTVGFERYTKLRHFSMGLIAGLFVVTSPSVGVGVQLAPTLKYTF